MVRGRWLVVVELALLAASGLACRAAPTTAWPEAAGVVARSADGTITVAEVDEWVLALPASERAQAGSDLSAWYATQIREMVVTRRLLAEASADDEDFRRAELMAAVGIAVEHCLSARYPDIRTVGEDELRARYEQDESSFAVPERRLVSHLFIRRDEGAAAATARDEAHRLRAAVVAGQGFARVVAASSDSESRHSGGSIGWISPGQLPEGFEQVIFALPERTPSEPIMTRDGAHLFFVEQILPARTLDFDELRPTLTRLVVSQRVEEALRQLDRGDRAPQGGLVLDRPALEQAVASADPTVVVLRLGELELTLAELERAVRRRSRAAGAGLGVDDAWSTLEAWRRNAEVAERCRREGHVDEQAVAARLRRWRSEALLERQRQRRLLELARREEDALELYYRSNIGFYSQPPAWRVERLSLPLGDDPQALMGRLERAAASPGEDLVSLRAELGGELEELGWQSADELRARKGTLPALVAPLRRGALTPPYQAEGRVEILRLVDRREPRALPFAEVRERVAEDYASQYTRELYQRLEDATLAAAGLEILPEGLAALASPTRQLPELSVEELESLLGSL